MKALAALALGLLVACGGEEKPVPPPGAAASASAPAGGAGLRPLTSRDGAAEAGSVPSTDSFPPGHPPIGDAPRPGGDSGPPVKGTISVGPQVAGRLVPNEVLFIVARSATSKQVVAVRKEEGARFPFAFEISGADAMVEGTSFTGPFDITARISKSGDAIPSSGDIEGFARGVATGASGVTITLDSVRQ